MATSPHRLAALIEAHQSETGASLISLANRIGVTSKTLIQWRRSGLHGRLPSRSVLESVAATLNLPYRRVLDAALHDAGFVQDDTEPRSYRDVLDATVSALTEAASLRRSPAADAPWTADRIDWGAFVCESVAAAAANGGGSGPVLSGRPGSWEADHVRAILASTLGPDDEHVWDYRTEPILVTLPLAGIVDVLDPTFDRRYQEADQALNQPYTTALAKFEAAGVFPEPALSFETATAEEIQEAVNAPTVLTLEDQTLVDLSAREEELRDQLRASQINDLREYGQRLAAAVESRIRAITPPSVSLTIEIDPLTEPFEREVPATHVDETDGPIEKAIAEAITATAPPACSAPNPPAS